MDVVYTILPMKRSRISVNFKVGKQVPYNIVEIFHPPINFSLTYNGYPAKFRVGNFDLFPKYIPGKVANFQRWNEIPLQSFKYCT